MADAVRGHEVRVGCAGGDVFQHRMSLLVILVTLRAGTQNGFCVEPNFIQEGGKEHFSVGQGLLVRFEATLRTKVQIEVAHHASPAVIPVGLTVDNPFLA